jgi:putative ABC transport system permease protein
MMRDMGRHKTQFLSIFLMAFLAIFIYAGVGGEWRGIQHSADAFYVETNLADVWIYGDGFTDEQVAAVLALPDVTAVERRLELNAIGDFENSPVIGVRFVEKNEISKLWLVEGENFDSDDLNGIWLDKRFADAHDLAIGDEISVTSNGIQMDKKIRGIIYDSERVFLADSEALTPDFSAFGRAYLPEKAFPVPEVFQYSTLLLKINQVDRVALEEEISAALDGKYSVFLEQKDHPSVSMFANEIAQHKMMGDIFPVVFLLIALLTMLTTMTRIVTGQRIQVGTLKALGFNKSTIQRHYIGYGFGLALLGSVCGVFVGPAVLPPLFYPSMSSFYTIPEWKSAFDISYLWMSALLVVLCTVVTTFACAKLLKESPADTLRPKAPKIFRHGFLDRTAFWEKVGFNAQWNLRDASRNKARSLMAIIGVFGCTALIVCALSMNGSMEDLKVWQYEDVNKFESKLTLDEDVTEEQLREIVRETRGEKIMESHVEVRANGVKKSGTLLVTDDVTLIQPTDEKLQPTTLPSDGISFTEKFADLLGVAEGDAIEWHVYGTEGWLSGKVDAVYREPVNQGLAMTREHFESLDQTFRATGVVSAQKVSKKSDGVESIQSTAEIVAGWDDLTEALYIMVYLLIAAAAVLSIVVLYNLGLLSFTEMEREMATLKVMGLKSGKLRGLLLTQNLWFCVIGFALGIPGGLWLTEYIVSFSGDSFDFPVTLHPDALFLCAAFTFGLSIFVNLLFSRKIRKLNMVESLKAIE